MCPYVYICSYVCICAYMCISVHICAYLCISVHIQKLNFSKKKLNFSKKNNLVLNSFSEKAGLYAPQNFKIPLSTPGIDPRTFLVCATALTVALTQLWKSFILSGTYFWNMFISVNICSYLFISVHMRVYACIYRSYPDLVRFWPVSVPIWMGGPSRRSGSPDTGSL